MQTVLQKTPSTGEGVDGVPWYLSNWLIVYTSRIGHFAGEARRTWEDGVENQVFPSSWCGHTLSGIFGLFVCLFVLETQAGNPTYGSK